MIDIIVGHVYRCVWRSHTFDTYYNYVAGESGRGFEYDAVCTTVGDYSSSITVDTATKTVVYTEVSCNSRAAGINEATSELEDMGTLEDFINNNPELFI